MGILDAVKQRPPSAGEPTADHPENVPSTHRERVGWCFYDWANSAFATTVGGLLLGPYLTTVTKAAADADGFVYPLGLPLSYRSLVPLLVALTAILEVVCLPLLGAISDYSRWRKQMLAFFAYVGAGLTMGLFFLEGANYQLGAILFVFAGFSMGASVVFYNAFLPDLASPDQRDSLSSRGWALGYLGGGLLLAANLALITLAQNGSISVSYGLAVRISMASAGVWIAVFTLIPLVTLRNRDAVKRLPPGETYLTVGFKQLRHTLGTVGNYPQTLLFLVAFLIYSDGIQAVMALATVFGQEELGLSLSVLAGAYLMAQFIGIAGALLFGRLARVVGSRRAIMISLVIWTASLVFAFAVLRTAVDFFILAAVIAIPLGGSQALSRSLYSQMIPRGREAEYYSVYEISERGSSVFAPLVFAVVVQFTGSYRLAILSLIVFFAVGLALLSRLNVRKGAIEAGNEVPAVV